MGRGYVLEEGVDGTLRYFSSTGTESSPSIELMSLEDPLLFVRRLLALGLSNSGFMFPLRHSNMFKSTGFPWEPNR